MAREKNKQLKSYHHTNSRMITQAKENEQVELELRNANSRYYRESISSKNEDTTKTLKFNNSDRWQLNKKR